MQHQLYIYNPVLPSIAGILIKLTRSANNLVKPNFAHVESRLNRILISCLDANYLALILVIPFKQLKVLGFIDQRIHYLPI